MWQFSPLFEVIKLEFILKLKIKRSDWLLADTCPQATNHCTLFEFEIVLKFYNLEAWSYRLACFVLRSENFPLDTNARLKTKSMAVPYMSSSFANSELGRSRVSAKEPLGLDTCFIPSFRILGEIKPTKLLYRYCTFQSKYEFPRDS